MSAPSIKTRSVEQEASDVFVQRLQGEWTAEQQAELDARLGADSVFAAAFLRAQASWTALEKHAEAPEIMRHREAALAFARRANARRWSASGARGRRRLAASIAGVAIALGVAWQLSPYGYVPGQYETRLGEQRTLDLEDRSRIALDAMTKVRVRFSKDARVIDLMYGQAQFNVVHDPARPFKVLAGNREIIAVGTVFTVEYANHEVHVAMLEGRVAVLGASETTDERRSQRSSSRSLPPPRTIELGAGEEMRVSASGETTVTPNADLEAATAWREGKIIFRSEPLDEAIRRVNRYSHVQIDLKADALGSSKISGVFEAGDTHGFVDAIERYLPVTAYNMESDRIELRVR